MLDWFPLIVAATIGFLVGRFFPLAKKFKKFMDKEDANKKNDGEKRI